MMRRMTGGQGKGWRDARQKVMEAGRARRGHGCPIVSSLGFKIGLTISRPKKWLAPMRWSLALMTLLVSSNRSFRRVACATVWTEVCNLFQRGLETHPAAKLIDTYLHIICVIPPCPSYERKVKEVAGC